MILDMPEAVNSVSVDMCVYVRFHMTSGMKGVEVLMVVTSASQSTETLFESSRCCLQLV